MNVLLVSMVKFPPLCDFLHEKRPTNCGWIYSSVKSLLNISSDVHLGVVVGDKVVKLCHYIVENIDYYVVPVKDLGKCTKSMIRCCKTVIDEFQPDLIHIYGTEHSMALAMAKANMKKYPILASIQGLASVIERYADGYLPEHCKFFNVTFYDFYRGTFLLRLKHVFKKRGNCEEQVIQLLTHITGRTTWDKVHVLTVNPSLNYFHMDETLRENFYHGRKWSQNTCKLHTIFVSNSIEPIKGAHNIVKALPIILRRFPDTRVYFVGKDVFSQDIKVRLSLSGYNLYLKRLIKKLHVREHVSFLGTLSAEEMKEAFLSAHVYVLPSAIENSPNSLGEAQLLGVPAIGTYCGGIPDMISDRETGYLYRYSEYEMLAELVIQVFSNIDLQNLSNKEILIAQNRHCSNKNVRRLINIYETITGCHIGLNK